jgi:hypothetical protein
MDCFHRKSAVVSRPERANLANDRQPTLDSSGLFCHAWATRGEDKWHGSRRLTRREAYRTLDWAGMVGCGLACDRANAHSIGQVCPANGRDPSCRLDRRDFCLRHHNVHSVGSGNPAAIGAPRHRCADERDNQRQGYSGECGNRCGGHDAITAANEKSLANRPTA